MSFFPAPCHTPKVQDQVLTSGCHSGCSIWAVELIRREIVKTHSDATNVNAVLIDFFLYDLAKEREAQGACVPRSPQAFFVKMSSCSCLSSEERTERDRQFAGRREW